MSANSGCSGSAYSGKDVIRLLAFPGDRTSPRGRFGGNVQPGAILRIRGDGKDSIRNKSGMSIWRRRKSWHSTSVPQWAVSLSDLKLTQGEAGSVLEGRCPMKSQALQDSDGGRWGWENAWQC